MSDPGGIREVFEANSAPLNDCGVGIHKETLPAILADYGVDDEFVPALTQILTCRGRDGVSWNEWCNFFDVLSSGSPYRFQKMLFSAIGTTNDNTVGVNDLIEFGKLIGDPIDVGDAQEIISQWSTEKDAATFEGFWNWYKHAHGFEYFSDEEESSPSE
jgi:hypothetical protein